MRVEWLNHNGITRTSVQFRGKEVERQPLRGIVMILGIISGVIAVGVGLFLILVGIILTPVWIILHFTLKALGRRGFYEEKDGHLKLAIGYEGFKRR